MNVNFRYRMKIISIVACSLLITVSFSSIALSSSETYIIDEDGEKTIEELSSKTPFPNDNNIYIKRSDFTPGNVTYPDNLQDINNSADYLIITSDCFYVPAKQDNENGTLENKLNELAHWRASYNGFDVAIVNVNDSFIGGNIDTNIKDSIGYIYENWSAPHISDDHAKYMLLVGDTCHVVSHPLGPYSDAGVSDSWYGCFHYNCDTGHYEGDEDYSTLDIAIGRFSVDNDIELSVIVNKTIQYEQNYSDDEDWHKKVLMVKGTEDVGELDWYSFVNETLLGLGGWNVYKIFHEEGGNTSNIIDNINDGRSFVVYCGHGDPGGWRDPSFYGSDINQLNNGNKTPIVYSLACLTGRFQSGSDCMGEKLLNVPGKGAVAFFGASEPSSGGSFWFADALFRSMFEDFEYTLGDIIVEGYAENPTYFEFNLLGDPALDISGSGGHQEKPDLAISHLNITISPENPSTEDEEIMINATIHNIGRNITSNVNVQFYAIDVNSADHYIGGKNISETLLPGDQYTILQVWDVSDMAGEYDIVVQIDPEDNIDEAYELNNQAGIKGIIITVNITYVDDGYNEFTPGWQITHFDKIQDGIDSVSPHGTVYVGRGTYYEHIVIDKPINLLGDYTTQTKIDGGGSGTGIIIVSTADGAIISGFFILNAAIGIHMDHTNNNIIAGNRISTDISDKAIYLYYSSNNDITCNYIHGANYGIKILNSNGNRIHHNCFSNNDIHAYDTSNNNFWNRGYPFGGNMWNGYDDHDEYIGSDQNIPGSDNIVDLPGGGLNPYNISGPLSSQDIYPRINLINLSIDGRYKFADAQGPYSGVIDEPVQFNGYAFGSHPPFNYYWDFGDGNTSEGQNPIHTYTQLGEYTVTLSVTDRKGSQTINTTNVVITTPIVVYVSESFDSSTPGWEHDHFNTIQEGIDRVNEEGYVYVNNGVYSEEIIIDKSINLIGENKFTTIIQGNSLSDAVVYIQDINLVNITGFSIQNGTYGIYVESSSDIVIHDNIIAKNKKPLGNGIGIRIETSENITILDNEIFENTWGIHATSDSSKITISSNAIRDNTLLMILLPSLINDPADRGSDKPPSSLRSSIDPENDQMYMPSDNSAKLLNRGGGIKIDGSANNITIFENNINHNFYGIIIKSASTNNHIYHNNFNQKKNAYDEGENNIWDNDSYGGNYWDNFEELYPDANELDNSGMWDTPYEIAGGDSRDRYPFMARSGWVNHPPSIPGNPSPVDGATNQDIDVDLSWSGDDPDSDDTVTYDVYFAANDPTPDSLMSNNQTDTSFDPGILDYETHYYWKIVAWDNHGVSTEGPIWDFTTTIGLGWISPTGHNDPENMWEDESNAYDQNPLTSTSGEAVGYGWQWTSWLELTISSPIDCDRIRFWAYSSGYCNEIDIDVFYSNDWHDVYQGSYIDREWVEKTFSEQSVTKARVKFKVRGVYSPGIANLYEFQFYEVS